MARNEAVYGTPLVAVKGGLYSYEGLWLTGYQPAEGLPVRSWRYEYLKRIFDFLCALVMVILFAIPGILIAIAICITSKGPIFYREQRIGRYGQFFRIWKFRSMRREAALHEYVTGSQANGKVLQWRMLKQGNDPRVTPVGRFLRCWSLDELPQLFNVLRGEMSFIGPRPIVEKEVMLYGERVSFYLAATPGLSGLWQISGRSGIGYGERAKLDTLYVKSWSLKTDIYIFFRTIPAVLYRRGAC